MSTTRQLRRSARRRNPESDAPEVRPVSSVIRSSRRAAVEATGNAAAAAATTAGPNDDKSQASNAESVAEDDLCPICTLLLYRPVTTNCNHTLCESCMAYWAEVSVNAHIPIVDVDEQPQNFDSVSGLEARCPMCRTQTSASLDIRRGEELARRYPQAWQARESEALEDVRNGEISGVQTLTLHVGNRHQLVDSLASSPETGRSNEHEWTFFVKPSRTDIIEEVQILLHPTFRPNRIIRARAPYELRRTSWGTFTITAYIILKPGYSWISPDAEDSPDGATKGMLPLEWTLDFDGFSGKGSMGRYRLKVKNDRDWESDSDEEERRDKAEWERMVRQYQRDGRWEPPEEEE